MNAKREIKTYEFEAEVVVHTIAAKDPKPTSRTLHYTVVFLPPSFHDALPLRAHPRLRVHATVAEIPVDGAFVPWSGRWYLLLSKAVLRQAGVTVGDLVEVAFSVADQDAVNVPDVLHDALERDAKAKRAWSSLTPGKRRALAHRVASAKTAPTQSRRLAEVLATLRDGR